MIGFQQDPDAREEQERRDRLQWEYDKSEAEKNLAKIDVEIAGQKRRVKIPALIFGSLAALGLLALVVTPATTIGFIGYIALISGTMATGVSLLQLVDVRKFQKRRAEALEAVEHFAVTEREDRV